MNAAAIPARPTGILFIGGGTMCRAIVEGGVTAGVLAPDGVVICEVHDERRVAWERQGFATTSDVAEGVRQLNVRDRAGDGHVVLAVKPQMLHDVSTPLRTALADGPVRTVVSILAGARTGTLERVLGDRARVIRVMPNTPAQIRLGCAAIALGASARPGDERFTRDLFAALGSVHVLEEAQIDAFTAVAGSGPAYVFFLAECVMRAAIEEGFTPVQADTIVRAVIRGAAGLLARDGAESPEHLRAAVTSKGGTTAAAIEALETSGVREAFCRAVRAATNRGAQLSDLADAPRA